MEWRIVNGKLDMSDIDVYVETVPVIKYFFAEISNTNLPTLLSQMLSSSSYSQKVASIRFFHELDWEDIQALKHIGGIKDKEVNIYHQVYGDFVMSKQLFFQVLYEYSLKVFEINKEKLPVEWSKQMAERIVAIKNIK